MQNLSMGDHKHWTQDPRIQSL